jgi:predicted PurR-regulated permease PerM
MNKITTQEWASYFFSFLFLTAILLLHLLPALLAGLLVHQIVISLAPRFKMSRGKSKVLVVSLIALFVVIVTGLLGWAATTFLRGEMGSIPQLMQRMAGILSDTRMALPESLQPWVPEADATALQTQAADWLREHAVELRTIGGETLRTLMHMLVGMLIGAFVSLHEATENTALGPLGSAMKQRAAWLSDAFHRVVFAQVRIAGINAALTALYLMAVLPLLGIHLPMSKTLVAATFVFGLIPVLGNLLSNTAIVVISLSVSPLLAVVSLAFLVVLHKFEYFLNAKIVGHQINAAIWELLLAMFLLESVFGIAGVVAAPIYYAYLKKELVLRGQI